MRVITLNKLLVALSTAVITSFSGIRMAYAQSPTPGLGTPTVPAGDTTILLLAAGVLVLIVLGGVLWQARVRK